MKKNLQRFGASVLAAAMVAQSVALPAAAETTKIDSSVAQSVAASAASAASAVQSLPKFTSTADLIKQTAQTLAAQGEVHELEQDDAKLEATAQSKAGMSLAALENALAGGMLLILDPFVDVYDVDLEMMRYRPNNWPLIPMFVEVIRRSKRLPADYDMSHMLAIGAGCEAFNNKQLRNVEEFLKQHNCNLRFTAGYGSSEAGSNATLPMAPFPVRDGNVGVPMIHSVISIFKPGTQEELTYNTPGEICMTGPGVMLGYDRPEATAKALQVHADGKTWLHTGDIGYMSEDGVLYTMTRGASPRFGGGDLMVQPLENIVADADIKGIKDEFFVIVPDDEHEGCFLPYLYVQLKDGYTLDDVRDKINACLPERYMRPVEIFTIPERPFFHFKTNRIGLSKEIIAKRNQQKEKAKRNSFADGCIA